MFLLEKIVSPLFLPLPFCSLILVAGLVLLWTTRWQKAGKILISAGTGLLIILGCPILSSRLLRPLEQSFRPVEFLSENGTELPKVSFIVVLGGSYTSDPEIPENSQLGEASLSRVAQGVMLYRRIPGCKLIVSGGSWGERYPGSQVMGKVAADLGVPPGDILYESKSLDTDDEARLIRPMVGLAPFFLVTSAAHMRRAIALFKARGMNPIAVPADYLAWKPGGIRPDEIYPSDYGLRMANDWVYEKLGFWWEKIRKRV